MDARRTLRLPLVCVAVLLTGTPAAAATYTTPNFVVTAPSDDIAKQVGDLAEVYRDRLSTEWLGRKLPRWFRPCPVTVKVGQIGAGGATSFSFDRGEVFGWKMSIQGSLERILDSVLPHEVSHTIFACHFRRPLPRWADEGAATLVEHESERRRQTLFLEQVLQSNRRIPLRSLFAITEYPKDMDRVYTLYAQGYSLARFLVQRGGRAHFLRFVEDAHHRGWDEAVRSHYRLQNTELLERAWLDWIAAGSPEETPSEVEIAQNRNEVPAARPASAGQGPAPRNPNGATGLAVAASPLAPQASSAPGSVVRGQSPESDTLAGHTPFDDGRAETTRPANGRDLTAPSPRRSGSAPPTAATVAIGHTPPRVPVAASNAASWVPPTLVRPVYTVATESTSTPPRPTGRDLFSHFAP